MPTVKLTTTDDVAIVEIDNPPVNALSHGVPEGLIQAVESAAWDASVEPPDIHGLLTRIEDASKPVVMAIHGTALGGGLELAMAGHYRIADGAAQLGQPEVNLGIVPGAEGT